jgi:2-polyprenyl-6-methoxyphenol hydroxylase-like FAD-dependent oxidoreductase
MTTSASIEHAVVLGGSLAGLLAARVLAARVPRVTIVERDELAAVPALRKGTPQASHANNLVAAGVAIVEDLFPGLGHRIVACGGGRFDAAAEIRLVIGGTTLAAAPPGGAGYGYAVGRPQLEALIRAEVAAMPGVAIETAAVTGLVGDGRRVVGARVDRGGEAIAADLVVDAMGRGSPAPRWLAALGAPAPSEDVLDVDVRYASRAFARTIAAPVDRIVVVTPAAGTPRGGIALAIEGNRWLVTLYGYGVTPATELAGFRAFAGSLVAGDVAAIADGEPLDDGAAMRFPTARWRRQDRLAGPDGYLPLGDAVCSLNPCYGMGTASAALQARALADGLDRGLAGLSRRVHRRAAPWLGRAFELGRSSDLELAGVAGVERTPVPIVRYVGRARRVAGRDPLVSLALRRVSNLLDDRTRLLAPAIAWRVLTAGSRT